MSPLTRCRPVSVLLVLAALAVALAAAALAADTGPADAHALVTATEPRADSRITALPDRVVIHVVKKQATRAGDPIQVFDPDGVRIDAGDTMISDQGATISVGLRPGSRRSGTYNVVYKITSADTHIIHDRFSFSLIPLSNETVPAVGGEPAVRSDAPSPLSATAGRLRVVGPPGGSYLGATLVVVAFLALVIVVIRRRRHRHEEPGAPGFRVVTTGEHRLGPVAAQPLPRQQQAPLTAAPSVALPKAGWAAPTAPVPPRPLHPTSGAR